jgi:ketosteroid isomerase-like protein
MTRRSILLAAGGGLLLAGGLALWLPEPPRSPEEAIDATLDAMVAAAREGDLAGILEHVSERFHGHGMDRNQLKGMLFVELRRGRWTGVLLGDRKITLQGADAADVSARLLLAQGQSALPDRADAYRVTLEMALEDDGAWRVTTARWER